MSTYHRSSVAYPATTNSSQLDPSQRSRLIRSTRKIGAILGTTPLTDTAQGDVFPAYTHRPSFSHSSSTDSFGTSSLESLPVHISETMKRPSRPTPPEVKSSMAFLGPGFEDLPSKPKKLKHSKPPKISKQSPSKLSALAQRPLPLFLLPNSHTRTASRSSNDPPSPITPPSPTPPVLSAIELKRRKMAKLARYLGEPVPAELVFPPSARSSEESANDSGYSPQFRIFSPPIDEGTPRTRDTFLSRRPKAMLPMGESRGTPPAPSASVPTRRSSVHRSPSPAHPWNHTSFPSLDSALSSINQPPPANHPPPSSARQVVQPQASTSSNVSHPVPQIPNPPQPQFMRKPKESVTSVRSLPIPPTQTMAGPSFPPQISVPRPNAQSSIHSTLTQPAPYSPPPYMEPLRVASPGSESDNATTPTPSHHVVSSSVSSVASSSDASSQGPPTLPPPSFITSADRRRSNSLGDVPSLFEYSNLVIGENGLTMPHPGASPIPASTMRRLLELELEKWKVWEAEQEQREKLDKGEWEAKQGQEEEEEQEEEKEPEQREKVDKGKGKAVEPEEEVQEVTPGESEMVKDVPEIEKGKGKSEEQDKKEESSSRKEQVGAKGVENGDAGVGVEMERWREWEKAQEKEMEKIEKLANGNEPEMESVVETVIKITHARDPSPPDEKETPKPKLNVPPEPKSEETPKNLVVPGKVIRNLPARTSSMPKNAPVAPVKEKEVAQAPQTHYSTFSQNQERMILFRSNSRNSETFSIRSTKLFARLSSDDTRSILSETRSMLSPLSSIFVLPGSDDRPSRPSSMYSASADDSVIPVRVSATVNIRPPSRSSEWLVAPPTPRQRNGNIDIATAPLSDSTNPKHISVLPFKNTLPRSESDHEDAKKKKQKLASWKGEWNLEDIKDVQRHLRSLRLR